MEFSDIEKFLREEVARRPATKMSKSQRAMLPQSFSWDCMCGNSVLNCQYVGPPHEATLETIIHPNSRSEAFSNMLRSGQTSADALNNEQMKLSKQRIFKWNQSLNAWTEFGQKWTNQTLSEQLCDWLEGR